MGTPFLLYWEGRRRFVMGVAVQRVAGADGGWLMLFFFSMRRGNLDRLVVSVG